MYYIGIDVSRSRRALGPGRQRQNRARDEAGDRSRDYCPVYSRHRAAVERIGLERVVPPLGCLPGCSAMAGR